MKLEVKHLAPYLSYKLKFEINIYDQATIDGVMVGLNSREIEFSEIRKTITEIFSYDLCLPILHPLSDLTKEIEHNGEKFVPIDKINRWGKTEGLYPKVYGLCDREINSDLTTYGGFILLFL